MYFVIKIAVPLALGPAESSSHLSFPPAFCVRAVEMVVVVHGRAALGDVVVRQIFQVYPREMRFQKATSLPIPLTIAWWLLTGPVICSKENLVPQATWTFCWYDVFVYVNCVCKYNFLRNEARAMGRNPTGPLSYSAVRIVLNFTHRQNTNVASKMVDTFFPGSRPGHVTSVGRGHSKLGNSQDQGRPRHTLLRF